MNDRRTAGRRAQGGSTLLEVLVAIVIVVFGLLGLAGLQSRVNLAEAEAYQRSQAVVLLEDMVGRIEANRRQAESYKTTSALGTGAGVMDCATRTGPALDLCEWNNELLGAGETMGGSNVGAMLGARGCVDELVNTMPRQFKVSVVWQGAMPTIAPGATTCGQGEYGDDKTRRAITATVQIGCLLNDPATTLCISSF